MQVLVVKSWDRFQHYKDRDPPWIKLYRDTLSSEVWVLGTDTSRLLQVASTLLAARYSNRIPYNFKLLRKVASLDCTEAEFTEAVAHLVEHSFLEIQALEDKPAPSASKPLATCPSEGEGETEQSRAEGEQSARDEAGRIVPHGTPTSVPFDVLTKIRALYPTGEYTQAHWLDAERAIGALLAQGEPAAEIVAAAAAYAAQQQAKGNTTHIRAPSKFYREGYWKGPFPIPAKPENAMQRLMRLNGGTPNDDTRVIDHDAAASIAR